MRVDANRGNAARARGARARAAVAGPYARRSTHGHHGPWPCVLAAAARRSPAERAARNAALRRATRLARREQPALGERPAGTASRSWAHDAAGGSFTAGVQGSELARRRPRDRVGHIEQRNIQRAGGAGLPPPGDAGRIDAEQHASDQHALRASAAAGGSAAVGCSGSRARGRARSGG